MVARILDRHVPYFTRSYAHLQPRNSIPTRPNKAVTPPEGLAAILPWTCAVKIYVDASGWGLGMTAGDKWQAWRWRPDSPLLRRHPRTNEIYAHWAELKAVELGMWALIQAGLRKACVLVNTDNQVVFETLRRVIALGQPSLWDMSACQNALLVEGVGRIGVLLEKHSLELGIQWVAGETNPADWPSRGKGLWQDSRFAGGSQLPKNLARMVSIA